MATATPPSTAPPAAAPPADAAASPARGAERSARPRRRSFPWRSGASDLQPMEDRGWFGPDSVTWRVWSYPTGMTVGFSRAVVVEELDPFLIAPVKVSSKIYQQTRVRYDRTLRYFATYIFGDSRTIAKATGILMKVHSRVAAPDPVSGLLSDPNNPYQQLYIHVTAWHSILYTYETMGPGPLTAEEEAQYWADCATAAKAQTIDPDTVPRSREEVREYFARMRPRLAASEASQEAMAHLMRVDALMPQLPLLLRPASGLVAAVFRAAVISTMPRWQRRLANIRQPRVVDALVQPLMRVQFRLMDRSPKLKLRLLRALSPSTVPVAGPVLIGLPALSDEVVSPEETFRRHGAPTPGELYAQLGHDQSTVVFTPSEPVPLEVAERAAVR